MRATCPVSFAILLAASAVLAAEEAPSVESSKGKLERWGLSFEASLEARYDDNILQLSPRDIDRLNSQTAPTSRFLVSTPDDKVAVGELQARWRTKPIPRRETAIAADFDIYRYSKNSVKNYKDLGLSVTQELTPSVAHLSTLRASVSRTPRYYLRQLTDDDVSFVLGTRVREPATYAQVDYGLVFGQTIVRDRLSVSAGVERVRRNYNEFFAERDNTNDSWSLGVRGRPVSGSRFQAGLEYVKGSLDARGDLLSTPIPDDDISYDHDGFAIDVAYPWRGRHPGRVAARFEREKRDFTTANPFDTLRFGRSETRGDIQASLSQRLISGLDLIVDWRHTTNDAVFPPGVTSDDITDFTQNRWSLGLRYRLR